MSSIGMGLHQLSLPYAIFLVIRTHIPPRPLQYPHDDTFYVTPRTRNHIKAEFRGRDETVLVDLLMPPIFGRSSIPPL